MSTAKKNTARMPPRWFVRLAWVTHRGLYRLSRGRFGLWRPKPDGWGAMRLTTIGRRTGQERSVIVGYFEDGPQLVTMAMNGWGEGEPAWWLNLQAHADAAVELKDGTHPVRARAAKGEERERLWARWRDLGERSGESLMAEIDEYAARLSRDMAVVVLEPRTDGRS